MARSGYASSIRSALSDTDGKKRCCAHAFSDGKLLFASSVSAEERAGIINSYTSRVKCPNCLPSFIGGIFCCCGTVTDPDKAHHLEFSLSSPEERDALAAILAAHGFQGKTTERKRKYVLYWKDREIIADFLAFMGANASAFEYMNRCIEKDLRNDINREVNCDTANIGKTLNASERQILLIRTLIEHHVLDTLPESLRETALLRLSNDSLSLSQLGEIHTPPITKSCVNHRLTRLSEAAEQFLSSEKK